MKDIDISHHILAAALGLIVASHRRARTALPETVALRVRWGSASN